MLNEMGKRKITHVFIVGDFGLWTHMADGHEFLDMVDRAAEANKLSVFAVGGNHENWDHWEWFVKNMPTAKGFGMVRRRVLLAPKVHEFNLANLQFAIAGGAVSIDKEYRLAREKGQRDQWGNHIGKATGPKTLWWPGEQLTDEDVEKLRFNTRGKQIDILLTHDCSNYTPFSTRLKPDADSEIHRRRIDKVLGYTKPKFHFHGHMHTWYEWDNPYPHGYESVVKTYGLEANPDAQRYAGSNTGNWWGVFDTELMAFAPQGKGMNFRSLES